MSDNWIVEILQNALNTWNQKLAEVWALISTSPEAFKGGAVWNVIENIHGGLKAMGYGLLVLFFVIGVVKTCGSFAEIKRPEVAVRMTTSPVMPSALAAAPMRRGSTDRATSLKAEVGPWYSSST